MKKIWKLEPGKIRCNVSNRKLKNKLLRLKNSSIANHYNNKMLGAEFAWDIDLSIDQLKTAEKNLGVKCEGY